MGIGKLLVCPEMLTTFIAIIPGHIVGSADASPHVALLIEADGIPNGCELSCIVEVSDMSQTARLVVIDQPSGACAVAA